jgi:hypothetical protein
MIAAAPVLQCGLNIDQPNVILSLKAYFGCIILLDHGERSPSMQLAYSSSSLSYKAWLLGMVRGDTWPPGGSEMPSDKHVSTLYFLHKPHEPPSMAPIPYLSIFLIALTTVCLAEMAADLGRKSDLSSDLDLLDVLLVASVDGKFHALNRTSGNTLWSMSSFPSSTSISAPATLGPLVRTNHVDQAPDLTDETTNQELYVIEPQSGDIYVMATPTSPLQRLPYSMSELVDMSPFSFLWSGDHRIFVGHKETSLLRIELETGKFKATRTSSECPWDLYDDQNDGDREVDLDELETSKAQTSSPTEVFISRTGESQHLLSE